MELDLTSLQEAVHALGETLARANDEKLMSSLDEVTQLAIRAGVIQHFEFTYELSWNFALIHLDKTQLTLVKAILRAHVSDRRVAAFGSRVQGTAREFSDLDLVILGDEPVAADVLSELRYALAESDLSISVDVVEWATLSPSFRRAIERTPLEIVQEPTVTAPLTVN